MATGTMGVTMVELVGTCVANAEDFHVEEEGLSGQGVIRVDEDDVVFHVRHPQRHALAIRSLSEEHHAGLELHIGGEGLTGDGLRTRAYAHTIAILRRNFRTELVADFLSFHLTLETGHDVACSLEIKMGIPIGGAVEHLSIGVGEGVMKGDDFIIGDFGHDFSLKGNEKKKPVRA
jgi:hypothetical protein